MRSKIRKLEDEVGRHEHELRELRRSDSEHEASSYVYSRTVERKLAALEHASRELRKAHETVRGALQGLAFEEDYEELWRRQDEQELMRQRSLDRQDLLNNRVVRGRTAFVVFCEEVRTQNPGQPAQRAAKKASQMWKAMSEDEKEPYERRALQDAASKANGAVSGSASNQSDKAPKKATNSKSKSTTTSSRKSTKGKSAANTNTRGSKSRKLVAANTAIDAPCMDLEVPNVAAFDDENEAPPVVKMEETFVGEEVSAAAAVVGDECAAAVVVDESSARRVDADRAEANECGALLSLEEIFAME